VATCAAQTVVYSADGYGVLGAVGEGSSGRCRRCPVARRPPNQIVAALRSVTGRWTANPTARGPPVSRSRCAAILFGPLVSAGIATVGIGAAGVGVWAQAGCSVSLPGDNGSGGCCQLIGVQWTSSRWAGCSSPLTGAVAVAVGGLLDRLCAPRALGRRPRWWCCRCFVAAMLLVSRSRVGEPTFLLAWELMAIASAGAGADRAPAPPQFVPAAIFYAVMTQLGFATIPAGTDGWLAASGGFGHVQAVSVRRPDGVRTAGIRAHACGIRVQGRPGAAARPGCRAHIRRAPSPGFGR